MFLARLALLMAVVIVIMALFVHKYAAGPTGMVCAGAICWSK